MKRHTDITDLSGMLKFDPRRLRRFIDLLDGRLPEHLRAPSGTLSVALFDDKKLAEIHGEFLNKPTETDVITFEGDPEDNFAGEVCASAERALNARHRTVQRPRASFACTSPTATCTLRA